MNIKFDDEIAKKVGVEASAFLCKLAYWMHQNRKENRNFKKGKYWCCNTVEELTEVFPFWTKHQVSYIIKKLRQSGIIQTDNFNKNKFDKTLWYTIVDEKIYNQSLQRIISND